MGGPFCRPQGLDGLTQWLCLTLLNRSIPSLPPPWSHPAQSDLRVCEVTETVSHHTFPPSLLVLCFCRELRLRNYVPEDEALKKRRVPQAKPVAGGSAEPLCLLRGRCRLPHLERCLPLLENS